MNNTIQPLDVVALTNDLKEYHLPRGMVGAVVECYANGNYEVEFVNTSTGATIALVELEFDQIMKLYHLPTSIFSREFVAA